MLFMLKKQHYTLTKVRKVKSYFTTPLISISHTPAQPLFHNLSLMNLGIVILEYSHDESSSSYMVVFIL